MAHKILKFKIRYKAEDKLSVQQNIEKQLELMSKDLNHHFLLNKKENFDYNNPELVIQDLLYQEQLYDSLVTISFDHSISQKTLGEIWNHICCFWCTRQKQDSFRGWLIPVVTDYYFTKKPFHHDLEVSEFAFGTIPDMSHFTQHYHYESHKSGELLCSFYHNQKHLDLFIATSHHSSCNYNDKRPEKVYVEYDTITRMIVTDVKDSDFVELLFQLSHIPFWFVERGTYHRNGELCADDQFAHSSVASDNAYREKKWERTLTIGCSCKKSVCTLERIGHSTVFKLVIKGKFRARCIVERLMHRCPTTTEFCYGHTQMILNPPKLKNVDKEIWRDHPVPTSVDEEIDHFNCEYAWRLVFSYSYDIRDQINSKYCDESLFIDHWGFIKRDLKAFRAKNSDALCNALYHIGDMITRSVIFDFCRALKLLFYHFCQSGKDSDLPDGMCLVRRAIFTPSKAILMPPMESFDNRIVRQFPEAVEYLLRVTIRDDNLSKLTFAVQYHSEKETILNQVAGNVLKRGFAIGRRKYEVLASSSSQLREHGLWLYAKDSQGRTAEDIRRWMGDFHSIKNVAKFMARMGQCFSSSDEAVQITIEHQNERCIDDIKSSEGTYTFSDGIGKISCDLAEQIRNAKEERMNVDSHEKRILYKPNAFQIRYKGCKGMVAEDPSLTKTVIAIRPSMIKFKCDSSNKLEIVKISAPRPLFLNRPLIIILEQMGVKPEVFLNLQKEMILRLTDSLIFEDKAAALLASDVLLNIPFKELWQSGICLTDEAFFRSLLIAVYKFSIRRLKSKARIAVPPQFGRNMLGVLDETRTLRYGEVFAQYSEEIGPYESKTHILKGTIVVTKNPCMHPGDVRKLQAVDVPQLHHIKDCIVFPANGHRPHTDEMAGSDLDGDEYVVIWMPELIFPAANHPPMHYPTPEERKHHNNIGVNEMVDFMCEYIQNDNIGTLAYAHLAWADSLKESIFSKICMDIAQKYPFVLDFAKTGRTEYLTYEQKPKSYPDFMEKGMRSNSYRSKRTLGMLYRFVKNIEACVNQADLSSYSIKLDPMLEYPGWKRYMKSAELHRQQYVTRVSSILNKYSISSETEALSGYLGSVLSCRQKQQEVENVTIIVKNYLVDTMNKYKYIFLNELEKEAQRESLSREERKIRKYQKASAWYMVTYSASESNILSFPWVLGSILCEVRNEVQLMRQCFIESAESSLLASLDNSLIQNFDDFDVRFECPCITIGQHVILSWTVTSKLSLSMQAEKKSCMLCFNRIFGHFSQTTRQKCCSWTEGGCHCSDKYGCSPAKLLLQFMKFYLSNVPNLGQCERNGCSGFYDFSLQSVALQTYANLAITRSNRCLGLSFDESSMPLHDDSNTEGDPIRIPMTRNLMCLVESKLDAMKDILKYMTGVKDIQITIEGDSHQERPGQAAREDNRSQYILISSTGTSWQRWALDQIILEPSLGDVLTQKIAEKYSEIQ